MSYGLYDGDWFTYGKSPFNLELMKLSSYYKSKRELVGFSPTFNPDMYSNFIYFKDYVDGNFEKNLSHYNNIECKGLAFSNGIYTPMDMDKELMRPDTSIYLRPLRNTILQDSEKEDFQILLSAAHMRVSLDGETIWEDFQKPLDIVKSTTLFYAHDPDLGSIKGAPAALKVLLEENKGTLGTKFPINIYNFEDLKAWLDIPLHRLATLIYNGYLTPSQLEEIVKYPQLQLDKLKYNVSYGCNNTQDFVYERFQQAFRTVAYLRMNHRRISLIYETQNLVEKEWENVFKLLNGYSNTSSVQDEKYDIVMKYDSMFSFCRNISKKPVYRGGFYMTADELRNTFLFVEKIDYKTFNDFYECHTVYNKNGRFEKYEQTR